METVSLQGCELCARGFASKSRFVEHVCQAHFPLLYVCGECPLRCEGRAVYAQHLRKAHSQRLCLGCGGVIEPRARHTCDSTALLFVCDSGNCRESVFPTARAFAQHATAQHQLSRDEQLRHLLENAARERPAEERGRGLAALLESEEGEASPEDVQELMGYAGLLRNNAASPSSREEAAHGSERKHHSRTILAEPSSSALPRRRPPPCPKQRLLPFAFDLHSQKDNGYELLMCRYKDNKRFIKSVKYEELLLKALSLAESLKLERDVFTVVRHGRAMRSPQLYRPDAFTDSFQIALRALPPGAECFEQLIEKQWRVETYSTVNNRLYEHKRHSNYMLNKRLKLFCENCKTQFRFFDEFIKHYRLCLYGSLAVLESFACPICAGCFINYFAMIQHLEIEHFIV